MLLISLLNPHVYLDTVVLVGAVGAGQRRRRCPAGFWPARGLASALWFVALGHGARLLKYRCSRPAALARTSIWAWRR